MSAVPNEDNRTQQPPPASSSRTSATTNGAAPLPPKTVSAASRPPDMTMNAGHATATTTSGTVARSFAPAGAAAPTTGTAAPGKPRHHKYKQAHDPRSAANSAAGLGPSGGSPADQDAAYCTELARRSVARAALHLGMEGMEGAALDALGSVLLGYMATVGTTISSNVEVSGRSSAHANAYDALNAVEVCTAPAATHLGSSAPTLAAETAASRDPCRGGDHQNRLKEAAQERGWEGLASFLFGPDWVSIPLEGESEDATKMASSGMKTNAASPLVGEKGGKILIQSNGKANIAAAAAPKKAPGGKTLLPKRPPNAAANSTLPPAPKSGKGKQLINMKGNEKSVSFSLLERKQSGNGGDGRADPAVPGDDEDASHNAGALGRWHAPYLNTVPSFPIVTNAEAVANPHRLPGGAQISLSLHDLATEMEACRAPPPPPAGKRPRTGSVRERDQQATLAARAARWKEDAAERAMRTALRIPDDVYTTRGTIWGSIQENGADGATKPPPAAAPPPAGGGDRAGAAASSGPGAPTTPPASAPPDAGDAPGAARRPSHVPRFLPPFPAERAAAAARRDRLSASAAAAMGAALARMHHREKRKPPAHGVPAAGAAAAVTAAETREAVRRAAIGLGRAAGPSYWGSGWPDDDDGADGGTTRSKPKNSSTAGFLSEATAVPSSAAKKSRANASSHVVPLGRASGSRLSKILEGSMNVS